MRTLNDYACIRKKRDFCTQYDPIILEGLTNPVTMSNPSPQHFYYAEHCVCTVLQLGMKHQVDKHRPPEAWFISLMYYTNLKYRIAKFRNIIPAIVGLRTVATFQIAAISSRDVH